MITTRRPPVPAGPCVWRRLPGADRATRWSDVEVAKVTISERGETTDRRRHIGRPPHDNRHVDDRLRGESGHRRTADVLDAIRDISYGGPDPRAKILEAARPLGIVFDNDDSRATLLHAPEVDSRLAWRRSLGGGRVRAAA